MVWKMFISTTDLISYFHVDFHRFHVYYSTFIPYQYWNIKGLIVNQSKLFWTSMSYLVDVSSVKSPFMPRGFMNELSMNIIRNISLNVVFLIWFKRISNIFPKAKMFLSKYYFKNNANNIKIPIKLSQTK